MREGPLNSWPADIAIVTSFPPAWDELAEVTTTLMADYARRHGYHFYADRSNWHEMKTGQSIRGFVKMDEMLRRMRQKKDGVQEYDTVVWIDADAVITNPEKSLAPFLVSEPFGGEQFRLRSLGIVVSYDVNGHHTTVIVADNTQLAREYLWAVNNAGRSMFLSHPWHEMEAMRYFAMTPPYDKLLRYVSVKQTCPILHEEYRKWVPEDIGQEYAWEPGDFIAHLSALPLERRIELARALRDNPNEYPPLKKDDA